MGKSIKKTFQSLDYQLIRSKRRSLTVEVTSLGEVIVRVPNRCPMEDVERFLSKNRPWIDKNIRINLLSLNKYLGEGGDVSSLTDSEKIFLTQEAKKDFSRRVDKWRPRVFGEEMPTSLFDFLPGKKRRKFGFFHGDIEISIGYRKTAWGSWHSSGAVFFNYLLMLAPEEVRDYVVVHELCHAIHPNHSKEFWWEVARVLPGYSVPRKWLKEKGTYLMCRCR